MNVFIVVRTYYDTKLRCDAMAIESCFRYKKLADQFCHDMNVLYRSDNETYSVVCKNIIDYDWKK